MSRSFIRVPWSPICIALAAATFILGAETRARLDPTREKLRARIDFEESRIILAPLSAADHPMPFDPEALLRAVHAEAGTTGAMEVPDEPVRGKMTGRDPGAPTLDGTADEGEDMDRRVFDFEADAADRRCGVYRARTPTHDIEVRLHDVQVLVRDRDRYHPEVSPSLPDTVLLQKSQALLAGLGAIPAEATSFDVRTLMAGARIEEAEDEAPMAQSAIVTRPLGKKVYFRRVLGDVEVAGNKMAFSFNLDGTFRKMRGRWTPLDYDRSQLSSQLSREQFVDRALDTLLAARVRPDSDLPIFLFTYFRPIEIPRAPAALRPAAEGADSSAASGRPPAECGMMAVDLRGLAIVEMQGPGDGTRLAQFDFDV